MNLALEDVRNFSRTSLTLGDLSIFLKTQKHTHTLYIYILHTNLLVLDKMDLMMVQKGHRNAL